MKWFLITPDDIIPGVSIDHSHDRPAVMIAGKPTILLSDAYLEANANANRVTEGSLEVRDAGSFTVETPRGESDNGALLLLRTVTYTGNNSPLVQINDSEDHPNIHLVKTELVNSVSIPEMGEFHTISRAWMLCSLDSGDTLTLSRRFSRALPKPELSGPFKRIRQMLQKTEYETVTEPMFSLSFDGEQVTRQ